MKYVFLTGLVAIGAMSCSSVASAQLGPTTVTAGSSEESTNDLFNGATVTGSSAILNGFSAADAFGVLTPNPTYQESAAGGHVIFASSGDNFINFSTGAPVTIAGFNILAGSDGTGNAFRGFNTVSLYANLAGVSTLLGTATYAPSIGGVTITGTFAPITASDFQFTSTSSNDGPRLLEIDAISPGAVPEPATWAMMMLGFGMIGFGLRRRSKQAVHVSYA